MEFLAYRLLDDELRYDAHYKPTQTELRRSQYIQKTIITVFRAQFRVKGQ